MALSIEGLTLKGNVGFTDTGYKEFITTDPRTGLPGDVADIARPTYKSDWTLRLVASYEFQKLNNGIYPFIRGDANWRSDYALTALPLYTSIGEPIAPINNEGLIRPDDGMFNIRLGVADIPVGSGLAALSLFGDNIFDEDYSFFGAPVAALQDSWERGATYGVELGFEF